MLLAVSLAALLCVSCGGFNQEACYEGVKMAYPESEVVIIPGEKYRFIVRTPAGDIIYVETMNTSDGDVTQAFTAIYGDTYRHRLAATLFIVR